MSVILHWQAVWTGPVVMMLAGIAILAIAYFWDAYFGGDE